MILLATIIVTFLPSQCGQRACAVQQVQAVQAVTPYVSAVTIPVPDPFWTYVVGQERENLLAGRKVDEMNERLARIEQALVNCQPGTTGGTPRIGSTPLDEQIQELMTTKCASCHSGDSAKGGLRLDQEGMYDVKTKVLIATRVRMGSMPPDNPLSDEESILFDQWMGQDPKALLEALKAIPGAKPTPAPPMPGSQSSTNSWRFGRVDENGRLVDFGSAIGEMPTRESNSLPYRLRIPPGLKILDDTHPSKSGDLRGIVDTRFKEPLR